MRFGRKKPPPKQNLIPAHKLSETDPRCQKITLKGTRCMLPHLPDSPLCAMHAASEAEKLARLTGGIHHP